MAYAIIDSKKFESDLKNIADTIRTKNETTEPLEFPQGFVDGIKPLVNEEDYIAKAYNKEITELVNDKITKIPVGFQQGNKQLRKVDLPNVIELNGTFGDCTILTRVNLPKVKTAKNGSFLWTSIEEIYMPSLETMPTWNATFQNCRLLKRAYFPKLIRADDRAWDSCTSLRTLILGADTVCTINTIAVLNNTPIKNGINGYYLYVPSALVEEYKAATNWSTIASNIKAIEDAPQDVKDWINELEGVG